VELTRCVSSKRNLLFAARRADIVSFQFNGLGIGFRLTAHKGIAIGIMGFIKIPARVLCYPRRDARLAKGTERD